MSSFTSRAWLAAGVLVVAGSSAAVWWAGRAPGRPVPRHNVLLITIDTLRADAVGAYGRAGSPTPLLDRLAAGGVRFADAHAHNVVTLPSHANILTGRLPPEHGVRDNGGFRLQPDDETLATRLRREGYRTGAFVSAFPLDSRFGLDAGFEVYDDHFTGSGPRPAFLIQERAAPATVAVARRWIDADDSQPWFAWVHLYEPHFPYEAPERFASRWPRDPYLGEVAAADAALGPVLEPVLAAGAAADTIVIVTSDHGEALGEHGEAGHGVFAYESVLRVPLVLYAPGLWRPAVVEEPASHVDLMPTVLEALGLPVTPDLAGRSLLPAIAGRGANDRRIVYFEALSASLTRGWAPLVGVIHEGYKYIDLPVQELYDLRRDPTEAHNLAAADPSRVASLRALLGTFPSRDPRASMRLETADVRERLRSLGYVAGSAAPQAGYSEADDPKRLIALDALMQEVLRRYLAGDLAGALAQSRELVRRRPSMAVSWMQLAQLERESGNLAAAIEAMQHAVALREGDAEPLTLLGAYLTEAGRAADASDLLSTYAASPRADPDLLATFALALARLGRFDESLAALARARSGDPSNAMLLVHLGTVQLTRGDRAAAREAFTEAVRINPEGARGHSSLAALALEDGQLAEAAEHWRAATSLDEREYGNVLALGIALARAGRQAQARACFEFFVRHAPPSRYAADLGRARAWLNTAR